MIAPLNPLLLMVAGGVAVMAAAGWLYASDRRGRAARQRISDITSLHASAGRPVLDGRRPWAESSSGVGGGGALARVLAYVGIETDRPDLYPIPWWMILFIASTLAVAVAGAGGFFIGPV